MTHPNVSVQHYITGYCLAIKNLIKSTDEEGRGAKVFDQTMVYAKQSHINPDFQEWLYTAKRLVGKENSDGFITLKEYDPQPQMGFLKHALVLAFYCLLRVDKDYCNDLTKGFDYAMR